MVKMFLVAGFKTLKEDSVSLMKNLLSHLSKILSAMILYPILFLYDRYSRARFKLDSWRAKSQELPRLVWIFVLIVLTSVAVKIFITKTVAKQIYQHAKEDVGFASIIVAKIFAFTISVLGWLVPISFIMYHLYVRVNTDIPTSIQLLQAIMLLVLLIFSYFSAQATKFSLRVWYGLYRNIKYDLFNI